MSFVPPGGELIAETQRQSKFRGHANYILGVPGTKQRPPVHLGGRGIIKEARCRPLQEALQAGEGCLAKLTQRNGLVRLEGLEPGAKAELVPSSRERDAVFKCVQIARDAEITSVVAA